MTKTKLQELCEQRTAGHCFHSYEDAVVAYDYCCACYLRKNERVSPTRQERLI